MGLRDLDSQWQKILSSAPFADEATVTLDSGEVFTMKGFFYAGSYGQRSEAKYIRERKVAKESFQVASIDIPYPIEKLIRKSTIEIREQLYAPIRFYGESGGVTVIELAKAEDIYGNQN